MAYCQNPQPRAWRNDQSKLAPDGGCDINWRQGNEVLWLLLFQGRPLADKWLCTFPQWHQKHLLHVISPQHHHWLQQVTALFFTHCRHECTLVSVECFYDTVTYSNKWTCHSNGPPRVASFIPFTHYWLLLWDRDLFSQLIWIEIAVEGPAV